MASTRILKLVGVTLELDDSEKSKIISQGVYPDHKIVQATEGEPRGYHSFKQEVYSLPNDETEVQRLSLQDKIWSLTFDRGLHISALASKPTAVLDIGTGAAQWAIDMAKAYPQCTITGTDLSPIQPRDAPSNTKFILQSCNEKWDFGETKFDLIHSRVILAGMRDWTHYLREAHRYLKPGGFVEMKETTFPLRYIRTNGQPIEPDSPLRSTAFCDLEISSEPHPLYLMTRLFQIGAEKAGLQPQAALTFKELLEEHGFTNIMFEQPKWPIGPWPKGQVEKQLGVLTAENTRSAALTAIGRGLMVGYLGWTQEEFEILLARAREELDQTSNGGGERCYYWQMIVASGQRL